MAQPSFTTSSASKGVAGHRLEPGTGALLLTLALGVFAGALDLNVLSPALPSLATEFGISARDISLTVTIYLLANVACIPIAGKLADRHGRRSVYIACVAIFAIGSLLTISAQSYPMFLLGRAIQAGGAGGIFPVATAAIADRVPEEKRGGALGILGAIWGLAGILGPIIGGIFTTAFSWRWIFIANIPLAAFVILMAQRHLPDKAPGRKGPLDIAGLALLTTALLATIVAFIRFDPHLHSLGGMLTSEIAAVIAVLAFALLYPVERKAAEPVLSPKLIGDREIRLTYGLELVIGAVEGSLFFVPAALHAGQHLSAAVSGIIAAIGALLFVGVIPLAGQAIDRIGARNVLSIGSLASAGGLLIFAFGYTSLPLSLAAMVLAGTGFGALLGAPTRYIIAQRAPKEMRSVAIGLLSIFLIIGQLVGSSLAGGLLGSDVLGLGAYRLLYIAFALLGLVACVITRFLTPPQTAHKAMGT